jgi:hypothetical protein
VSPVASRTRASFDAVFAAAGAKIVKAPPPHHGIWIGTGRLSLSDLCAQPSPGSDEAPDGVNPVPFLSWSNMPLVKAHVLHGKTFQVMQGPVRVPIVLGIAAITAASFFLNAVFAFAIAKPGPPVITPAFREARAHLTVILGWGAAIGICLGLATVVFVRWGL